jgi:hypothetical protein
MNHGQVAGLFVTVRQVLSYTGLLVVRQRASGIGDCCHTPANPDRLHSLAHALLFAGAIAILLSKEPADTGGAEAPRGLRS